MDAQVEKIIENLAIEFDKEEALIEECLRMAAIYARESMKSLDAPTILWPRFGTFQLKGQWCPKEVKQELKEYKATYHKPTGPQGQVTKTRKKESKVQVKQSEEEVFDKIMQGFDELNKLNEDLEK